MSDVIRPGPALAAFGLAISLRSDDGGGGDGVCAVWAGGTAAQLQPEGDTVTASSSQQPPNSAPASRPPALHSSLSPSPSPSPSPIHHPHRLSPITTNPLPFTKTHSHSSTHPVSRQLTVAAMSTRKRKNDEEELLALPSESEEEEEYVAFPSHPRPEQRGRRRLEL